MSHLIRVLLVSPPASGGLSGDFGDPHLVALGSYLRANTPADVEIINLDYERYLPSPDPQRVLSCDFDVVGISCYSSYDYLPAFCLAQQIRAHNPAAIIAAGGYHPSGRPGDFVQVEGSELEEASPFDHVVVGEGELPLARIVNGAARGERVAEKVLGPEPLASLDDLPPLDWHLLDRYRPVAAAISGQMNITLTRGCPFQCTFCMERSKGQSAWRPWSPQRAEAELRRVSEWLDLQDWTLFIADAAFGLDRAWRHEMLDRLVRLALPVQKIWTLCRIDTLSPGDIDRFNRANLSPGFGLESGDPRMLAMMCKTGDAHAYLGRFVEFAKEAARAGLPWGANMIAGHPGETAQSLEASAAFTRKLFLSTDQLTGFVSIDPYRYFAGSEVDRNLGSYVERFGTRVHRTRWWNFTEQAFTCEWVDPSQGLDWRTRESLTAKLFAPILQGVAERFCYRGPGREYFERSVAHAVEEFAPAHRLRKLGDYCLWRGLTGQGRTNLVADPEAAALLRAAREREVRRIVAERGEEPSASLTVALIDEPRERYVADEHMAESWRDQTMPLSADDASRLSAIHAYLVNYSLLELSAGDGLLELGSGSGYGAAVASRIVGSAGLVVTCEVREDMAEWAARNLADRANVRAVHGDGLSMADAGQFNKIVVTFAVEHVPQRLLDQLPEGGRLVAPVGLAATGEQVLTMFCRENGRIVESQHGEVRYVPASSSSAE